MMMHPHSTNNATFNFSLSFFNWYDIFNQSLPCVPWFYTNTHTHTPSQTSPEAVLSLPKAIQEVAFIIGRMQQQPS